MSEDSYVLRLYYPQYVPMANLITKVKVSSSANGIVIPKMYPTGLSQSVFPSTTVGMPYPARGPQTILPIPEIELGGKPNLPPSKLGTVEEIRDILDGKNNSKPKE